MKSFMKTFALAASANALSSGDDIKRQILDREFMGYAAAESKNYASMGELQMRKAIFEESVEKVKQMNMATQGASFKLNYFADMTDSEMKQLSNDHMEQSEQEALYAEYEQPSFAYYNLNLLLGASLPATNYSINWAEQGKTTPVKYQGFCSSCYAFAGTTVQETMQAIKYDTEPVRLSEQEGIDCDDRQQGCRGGRHEWYWEYSNDNGSQLYETYPYESQRGDCRHQEDKAVASRADKDTIKRWSYRSMSTEQMMQQLQEGPFAVAVDSQKDCWRYYQSGILTSENCPLTRLDHAVVVVGVHQAVDANDTSYWIIQNSWGAEWGENGFVKLAVEEGRGVSGMNMMISAMQVQ